jgi:hypothetical protein
LPIEREDSSGSSLGGGTSSAAKALARQAPDRSGTSIINPMYRADELLILLAMVELLNFSIMIFRRADFSFSLST